MPEEQKAEEGRPTIISEISHERGVDYKTIYSNFVQCGFTPWDVALQFGQMGETSKDTPLITDQAIVYLTPALAKAFVAVVSGNLRNYEAQFGEIKMPKGFGPRFKEPESQTETAPPIDATDKPPAG
ncbi:MAG: DUF3467 domain-containing protein [Pyrinomonadaceae bacterium]